MCWISPVKKHVSLFSKTLSHVVLMKRQKAAIRFMFFFFSFRCTESSWVSMCCLVNWKKIREIKSWKYMTQQIWSALPNDAIMCMVASIHWCRITIFHSSVHSFISLSPFPELPLYPPLFISLTISISIVFSIFPAISISLYIAANENYSVRNWPPRSGFVILHHESGSGFCCNLSSTFLKLLF